MTYESEYENEEDVDVVLEMLREDLIGELQAINQYQEHIDSLDDEESIKVLEHIRDDEKEHVAELTKLIQKLDPIQAEMFKREGL
ncbi:MAG: demethoxyubiquinone hydroxylase family protein [Dehalococcoidia bacterium]